MKRIFAAGASAAARRAWRRDREVDRVLGRDRHAAAVDAESGTEGREHGAGIAMGLTGLGVASGLGVLGVYRQHVVLSRVADRLGYDRPGEMAPA